MCMCGCWSRIYIYIFSIEITYVFISILLKKGCCPAPFGVLIHPPKNNTPGVLTQGCCGAPEVLTSTLTGAERFI